MGNSNSSMRDQIRSYYRSPKVAAKQLATAPEDTRAAVQTKLTLLEASKKNMESEYINFLKEYAPYSNAVLKVDGTALDFERPTPFSNYPEIITF